MVGKKCYTDIIDVKSIPDSCLSTAKTKYRVA